MEKERVSPSLYYLSRFDGGDLFRVHILSKLEKYELDVSVMLSLRTVCKAWLFVPSCMSTVCSISESQKRKDITFYDAVLQHFPSTRKLKLLAKDSPLMLHDLFLNLEKLVLVGIQDPNCDFSFLFAMTRLTSLSLSAANSTLNDKQLSCLLNLRSLFLRGPFPNLHGSCLSAFEKLEKLSIHTVSSIRPTLFAQANPARWKLTVNSSTLLKNSHYTGRCNLYAYKEDRLCYVGPFVNGEMMGEGSYFYASGCKYIGNWENSQRSGFGIYFFMNGNRYEGSWLGDVRAGLGTLYFKDGGWYKGDWKNDTREGYGVQVFQSGSRYEGSWKSGKRTGQGVCYYPDGGQYQGDWVEDKRKGYGTLYWANGLRYIGEWDKNVREGSGVFYNDIWFDSDMVEGEWKDDELQPFGMYYFGRGTKQAIQYALAAGFAVVTGSVLLKAFRKFS